MTALLSRRSVLGGAAALMAGLPSLGARAAEGTLAFDVLRGDDPIGRHVLGFRRDGERLTVEVTIELEVVMAWVTVFRYSHRNTEVWRGGLLEQLDSRTDDDGTDHVVTARRQGDALVVDGDDGRLEVPGDMLTTAYWHPLTMSRDRLLDTQHGHVAESITSFAGTDRIEVAGHMVDARRYEVAGDLELTAWYDPDGRWSGLAFDARGERVVYRPVQVLADDSWDVIAQSVAA